MEITPQQGLILRYFVTNNISEVVQKNVHFDDKIQVFSDSNLNEFENMQWMTDDWNKQTLQTTSQHIAFIDDDGDTHFFDAQDGQDNFYDAEETHSESDQVTPHDNECSADSKITAWINACATPAKDVLNKIDGLQSDKRSSGHKKKLRKLLAMGALTINPLIQTATALSSNSHLSPSTRQQVNTLSQKASHALWHNRLTHFHDGAISDLHKYVDGVPKLPVPTKNRIFPCPSCSTGKAQLADMNEPDVNHIAERPGQAFYMDYGFVNSKVQNRDTENEEEKKGLVSSQGFKSYLLIKDQFTKYKWVLLTKNKKPPLEQLRIFLQVYGCQISQNKWIRTDRGGELNGSEDIRTMIHKYFGYTPQCTAAHASVQNGFCEVGHREIGERLRTMLWAANLPLKYWDYALVHAIFVANCIPSKGQNISPFEALTGKRPNLAQLRTWGCTVYVRDKATRANKLDCDTSVGTFLGYSGTTKNAIFLSHSSGYIRVGTHVKFDEGNQLQEKRPPQAILLSQAFGNNEKEALTTLSENLSSDDIDISPYPSDKLLTTKLHVPSGTTSLGLKVELNNGTVMIGDIDKKGLFASKLPFHQRYKFTRLLEINTKNISSISDYNTVQTNI